MAQDASKPYECKTCGKEFGDSLGDMQRHMLVEHLQKGDISSEKPA